MMADQLNEQRLAQAYPTRLAQAKAAGEEITQLKAELEKALGLLEQSQVNFNAYGVSMRTKIKVQAFLTKHGEGRGK